jgi:hypothetical protein
VCDLDVMDVPSIVRLTRKLTTLARVRSTLLLSIESIMSTKADKTDKKITHHVPPRQMIYTKKQIGWNHEKR